MKDFGKTSRKPETLRGDVGGGCDDFSARTCTVHEQQKSIFPLVQNLHLQMEAGVIEQSVLDRSLPPGDVTNNTTGKWNARSSSKTLGNRTFRFRRVRNCRNIAREEVVS